MKSDPTSRIVPPGAAGLGFGLLFFLLSPSDAADTVALGPIKVVAQEKTILVPAHTVLYAGILEYLAVTPSGKTYESVMALDCEPVHLHAALLLINARTGKIVKAENYEDSYATGDILDIAILAGKAPAKREIPLLDLISFQNTAVKKKRQALIKKLRWVFTGSKETDVSGNGRPVIASSVTGSLISIVLDPTAEINLSQHIGIPYRGPEYGFKVNTELVRSIEEKYTVRIRKVGKFYDGPRKP